MKNFSLVLASLAGMCLVESNAYAIAGVICPAANQITYSCQKNGQPPQPPGSHCEYHTTSGTPNDFGPYNNATSCQSDFDCSIVAANSPYTTSPGNYEAICSYVTQGAQKYGWLLVSNHFSRYYYTPSDAPECNGATPSDKSGYCITYGNSYRK